MLRIWGAKVQYFRELRNFLSGISKGRSKIVSEYDQEIPQSQTADNPVALWQNALFLGIKEAQTPWGPQ